MMIAPAIRFSKDWRETVEGVVRRDASVAIDFDPSRLPFCRQNWRGAEVWNIDAFVRVHPRGEIVTGSVLKAIRQPPEGGMIVALQPAPFAFFVPPDTTQLELWFHNYYDVSAGCSAWDSRFGNNYWFEIAGDPPREPKEPVIYRWGAIPAPDMVNVERQEIVKKNVFPQSSPGPRAGTDLQTLVSLLVWVKNVAYVKSVWMDLHVFDGTDARIHAETFPLRYDGSAGGDADLFAFNGKVYQGTTATPGSVSPRPEARSVQYRVYYAVLGRIFTDGILHQQWLQEDAVTQ